MPKILATADLHGNLPEIPECDLLLIAGDICPDFLGKMHLGQYGEEQQAEWLDTSFRKWLEKIPAKEIVAIAGNHDFVFERPQMVPTDLRWFYLKDTDVEIEGLIIYGTPWVPNLRSWAFYGSSVALQVRAESIPSDVDILLSHGPVYGHGDTVLNGSHVGDVALGAELSRIKPKALICGHIHEGYGRYQDGDTQILNASHVDVFYDPVNKIMDLDLTNPS